MKRFLFPVTTILVCGLFAAILIARASGDGTAGGKTSDSSIVLDQAMALLEAGKLNEARTALATIDRKDANYPTAYGLDALCLYQQDKRKFLKLMNAPEMESVEFPAALREALDYDQIDALFFYRKFEEILPKIRGFAERHGNSPKLAAVAEYQMATLYERGMKKVYEACASRDTNVFQKRYEDGRSNLVDFLNVVVSLDEADYRFLPKRSLKEEIWAAQIALGNEKELETEIPYADRERATFLSLQLHQKLQLQAADDNLRRMTNFLNDFPDSKYRPRVMSGRVGDCFS